MSHGEFVEPAEVVHAIGDVVDIPTLPHLVVVGRSLCCLEKLAMIGENSLADATMGLVDELEKILDAEIIEID